MKLWPTFISWSTCLVDTLSWISSWGHQVLTLGLDSCSTPPMLVLDTYIQKGVQWQIGKGWCCQKLSRVRLFIEPRPPKPLQLALPFGQRVGKGTRKTTTINQTQPATSSIIMVVLLSAEIGWRRKNKKRQLNRPVNNVDNLPPCVLWCEDSFTAHKK
jgi:hypothetical protein